MTPPEKPDPELERFLRSMPARNLPASAEDALLAELDAVDAPRERGSSLRLLFVVAAMILAAVGVWGASRFFNKNMSTSSSNPTAQSSARGQFTVLQTNPAEQSLLAREFSDFETRSRVAGDTVGDYRLQSVDADTFTVQNKDGETVVNAVEAWNETALQALRAECAGYVRTGSGGALSNDALFRLQSMANLGLTEAATLLNQLEEAASPEASKEISRLRKLSKVATWAREGERATRVQALRTLAQDDSAWARRLLRELAFELEDDRLAEQCVQSIAGTDAREVLGLLAAGARSEGARAAAKTALEQISVTEELK